MQPSELELHTTEELVSELLRRKTFLGIVVHADQELKRDWTGEKTFRVRFNSNLEQSHVARLLDVITDHLNRCH